MMAYEIVRHPTSGERYAVEREMGALITRAGGPLHWRQIYDEGTLRCEVCDETESIRGQFPRDAEGGQCTACGSRVLTWSQDTIRDYLGNHTPEDRDDADWLRSELG